MDWSLAGYKGHPVDGEASVVAASASRLGGVAGDVRGQISQLKGLGRAEEIWESSAGSADRLQVALDELPEKLDLVATRYERVSEALDEFHPVLASARQDAEYWIVQAEAAQDEAERAEAGVAEMEDHENGDSDEEWEGEDHRAGLENAQGEAESAIANVRNAVEAFNTAAETCADAILDACNDNLQDHSTVTGAPTGLAPRFATGAAEDDTIQVEGGFGRFADGVIERAREQFGPGWRDPYERGNGGMVSDEQLEAIMRQTEYAHFVEEGIPDFVFDEGEDNTFYGSETDIGEAEKILFFECPECSEIYRRFSSENYIKGYLDERYDPDTGVLAPNKGDNTPVNAMKHAEFAAILTVFHGPRVAKQMMDAHENVFRVERHGEIFHSSLMDLYNNNVGIEIGKDILQRLDGNPAIEDGLDALYGREWGPLFDPNRIEGEDVIDVSGTGWADEGDLADLAEVQDMIVSEVEIAHDENTLLWREEDNWGFGN